MKGELLWGCRMIADTALGGLGSRQSFCHATAVTSHHTTFFLICDIGGWSKLVVPNLFKIKSLFSFMDLLVQKIPYPYQNIFTG